MKANLQNDLENLKGSADQQPFAEGPVFLSKSFILSLGKVLVVSTLSLTSFVQCGKQDEDAIAKNFSAVLVNPEPLVRFTDQSRNGRTLRAPWFEVELKVQNKSTRAVKIDEIEFYVTVNGVELNSKGLDFGSLDRTVGDNAVITYDNFCIYPNNSVAYYLSACATGRSDPNPASVPWVIAPVKIILDGLGEKDKIVNYSFPVRAIIRGASLDSNGIEVDRFSKTITFTTR